MTTTADTATAPRNTRCTGLFARLVALDAAYRQKHALKRATAEQLADMGLTREQADRAFVSRLGPARRTPRG